MAAPREDQVVEIAIPDWRLNQNKPAFVWGKGNKLLTFTTNFPDQKGKFDNSFNLMNEVVWGTSFYYPTTRKLVSEASGIFVALQKLDDDNGNETDKRNKRVKISRRYRSVIKECIDGLQTSADQTLDPELKSTYENQSQMFYKMELIWDLCEILFIDIQPGGIVLSQLLNWVKWHFPECEKNAREIVESEERENHPLYWNALYGFVLQGRIEEARKLLRIHTDFKSDSFLILDDLLKRMPTFLSFVEQQSISEFDMKWRFWQDECLQSLEANEFVLNKNVEKVCQILCGKPHVFAELAPLCETWYHMLISRLLYSNPTIKGCDLHYISEECVDMFGGIAKMNALDSILLALLEFDIIQVIKECSYYFDSWWFAAHLTDFLCHCKHLVIEDTQSIFVLRENLLLDFASCLMGHKSLWQIGVEYFRHCPLQGKRYLEAYLERIPLDNEWKVQKVLYIAEANNLHELVSSVCKIVAVQSLQKNSMGTALSWALKSKDSALTSSLAETFLKDYVKKGECGNLDLIDNLGPSMLISDKLTFLGKYREFHRLYEEKDFRAAAALLVSLLSSRLAPTYFWRTLLFDALPLLESPEILFSSEQTFELLYCLEELEKLKDTQEKNDVNKTNSKDKETLLRLALARNLARGFLEEKSVVCL